VLVCHEPPEDLPQLENLRIVQVETDVPADAAGFKADKAAKLDLGIRYLLRRPTRYCMHLDADDRVHRRLVEYVSTHDSQVGWVIDKGYVYQGGHFARAHNGKFERLCGSSFILAVDSGDVSQEHLQIGHTEVRRHFAMLGTPLPSLPFFGAVKVVGYGDNITVTRFVKSETVRRTLKKVLQLRLVGRRFRDDFAMSSPF